MKISVLAIGSSPTNCYLLSTEKAAVVIDPGVKDARVDAFLEENSDKERLIILTHAHFDHIGGAEELREKYGVKILISNKDNPALSDPVVNESVLFRVNINPFSADLTVEDGEEFSVGDISFKAYETPGHTVGSACFYTDGILFTGDTLFCRGIGRSDFHGGNQTQLFNSLRRIRELFPDETPVLSGHGPETTVGAEFNLFGF
ncbi:MAG: MBL fold metallo-hydrolase [Clostridia bacterium]|nr:MBL fold metallo-hydrolase [Clostridia bacterium]